MVHQNPPQNTTNNTENPTTQIAAGFTDEQQSYLENLIQSLDLHVALQSGSSESQDGNNAELTVHGTPLEDLSKEELLKHETHPWELYPELRKHSNEGKLPDGGNLFMFKHYGVFNVSPVQAAYMCRLRIPACQLRGDQLAMLGDMSEDLAGGYAHVTTRGNLQLREIGPDRLLDLLNGLYDIGLSCRGSGADSVRNITCSPTAGFDPTEIMDLRPYALELHQLILNSRHLHGIPRKFNIVFDCGGKVSCVSDTNDIAFIAEKHETEEDKDKVMCRILLGGITGHLDFARDTGFLCTPEQTVDVSVAMLEVFIENGDRTNRKKARLKYLLDKWGFDKFIEETQKKLSFELVRDVAPWANDPMQRDTNIDRTAHVGEFEQSQDGYIALGVALPLGRLTPDQMRGLGKVAQEMGGNEIRLTVWQNLMIPYIPSDKVEAATNAIRELGLDTQASSFAAGAVACTGKFGCKYASAYTKQDALASVQYLESKFDLDQPINIHLTGCSHSCAQHYIGDIGLIGASTQDGREAYQVYIGGGSDDSQAIAVHLNGPIAADQLPAYLEHLISTYLANRNDNESFFVFSRRLIDEGGEARLKEMFMLEGVAA